jgi:hypothetical protein
VCPHSRKQLEHGGWPRSNPNDRDGYWSPFRFG